ncbi:MAG: hypothetical protein ACRCYY_15050 [Trueperaceae bacterium]
MTAFFKILSCAVVCLALLTACLPISQQLPPSVSPIHYRIAPSEVQSSYSHLAGYPEPHTPSEFNQTMYSRYYIKGEIADTIIILQPGIFGGASSFDILARQLVAALPNTEVWAVDRRANLLEDLSAMQEALKQRDPMLAYDYYVTNLNKPNGFQPLGPDTLGFMRHWGLEVHLHDLHVIVKEANRQATNVILGGHSLGAALVNYYSSFVFPDGAGHEHIDALLLLDGVLGRTGGFNTPIGKVRLGELELLPGLGDLRRGNGAPYSDLLLPPAFYAQRESMALLAHFEPAANTPADIASFPISNLAAISIPNDDSYSGFIPFSSSMGDAVGATFGGNLSAALLAGPPGIYSKSVVGIAKGYERIDWQRGDPQENPVNPQAVMAVWVTPDTNRSEWYFPLRLAFEIASYDVRLENTPNFVPTSTVRTPTLAVGAERGLVTNLEGFAAYNNVRAGSLFSMYVLPRFTHLDIVYAERNPLVSIVAKWLEGLGV